MLESGNFVNNAHGFSSVSARWIAWFGRQKW